MNPDLLNLSSDRVLQVEDADGDDQIKAETLSPPGRCVHCGSIDLVGFGRREQWIRDLPIHGKRVGIAVDTRRFRCKSCGRTFYEPLPAVDDKRLMTTRLKTWLEKKSLRPPFSQLAEETGVGALTIRKVFDDCAQDLKDSLSFETPEVLGIDAVHLIRRSRAVFTNIPSCFVIEMLPDRNKTTVARYLADLPDKGRIRCVAIDMWRPYQDAARETLPGVPIVVDKFHVLKMANAALDTLRKTVGVTLPPEKRRSLMRYRHVLPKRFSDLNEVQRKRLDEWSRDFPALTKAHQAKEGFFDIYEAPSRSDAEKRYREWDASLDPEIRTTFGPLLTAFQNWEGSILAYFDHRVTNACTESSNNLIRAVQRMGRGYSFDVLRARILLNRHGAHRMKPFRRPGFMEKNRREDDRALGYGLPSADIEPEEISLGVDISTLLDLIEKGAI
uniref:Transposase n=1 Tax=Leptospirillum ferrodiazotrophum TaxID=412449 RepID=C6HZQ4_9BACT|nr:MAG: transposase [Leptospirillum ferrodiazotrophum]